MTPERSPSHPASRHHRAKYHRTIRMMEAEGKGLGQIVLKLDIDSALLARLKTEMQDIRPAYTNSAARKKHEGRDARLLALFESGRTIAEVADDLQLSERRVTEILLDAGVIQRVRPTMDQRTSRMRRIIELRHGKKTNAQIAQDLGMTEASVTYVVSQLIKAGVIESRSNTDDELIIQLRNENKTAAEIADKIGTSPGAVRQRISRLIKSGQLERKN